jgi:Glyoxalase-like domain
MPDGPYIELLSFTHPESHYPPSSPAHEARRTQPWANKPCGWVGYAFLGGAASPPQPLPPLSTLLNTRLRDEGSSTRYEAEVPGGRRRLDGIEIKWEITRPATMGEKVGGTRLPFFCRDLTRRELRVRACIYCGIYYYWRYFLSCDRYQHGRDQTLNIQMARWALHNSACWLHLAYLQGLQTN